MNFPFFLLLIPYCNPGTGFCFLKTIDIILPPLYLLTIYLIARRIQKKNIQSNPVYKYYVTGLFIKLFAGIIFCLIYTLYYQGGDTTSYFESGVALTKLMQKNFSQFFIIFCGNVSDTTYFFDNTTGHPSWYMWRDHPTFFVVRIISPIIFISFKSYITTTIMLCWISYFGIWKLYLSFVNFYPKLEKQLAISILFLPSLVFWGSGLGKDIVIVTCSFWFIYNMYKIFLKKEKIFINIIVGFVNIYLILSIKPYIFVSLFPSVLIWILFNWIKKIKSPVLRILTFPVYIIVGIYVFSFIFSKLKTQLGEFGTIEGIIKKAQITQQDLIREEAYGTHYYYLGKLEGTPRDFISKSPRAIIAGLFRPFLWEAENIVMLISAIENSIILLFTLYLLLKTRMKFFKFLLSDPLILFLLTYSLLSIFAIGTASANFGALVRYKIPAIPFFVAALFIIHYYYKQAKTEKPAISYQSPVASNS